MNRAEHEVEARRLAMRAHLAAVLDAGVEGDGMDWPLLVVGATAAIMFVICLSLAIYAVFP